MGAIEADQRALLQTAVAAEVEAEQREARRPRHFGDLKVGAQSRRALGKLPHRSEANRLIVQTWPRFALALTDNFPHFGTAETAAQRTPIFATPETRSFARSSGKCRHAFVCGYFSTSDNVRSQSEDSRDRLLPAHRSIAPMPNYNQKY